LSISIHVFQAIHLAHLQSAYEDKLSKKADEAVKLTVEVEALNAELQEAREDFKVKVSGGFNSSLISNALLQQQEAALSGSPEFGENNVKGDFMSEIHTYEHKLKEKDLVIEKLGHVSSLNEQLAQQIQEMNKMVHSATEEDALKMVRNTDVKNTRRDSFEVPTSFEPETMPDFVQMEEVRKLKSTIGSLVTAKTNSTRSRHNSSDLPPKVQKILDEKNATILKMREEIQAMKATTNDMLDDHDVASSASTPDKKSSLEVQVCS
jgi:hypothetical protein